MGQPKSLKNTFIISNTAESGSELYGGMLNRCTVSTLAEAYDSVRNELQYYLKKTVKSSSDSTIT